MDVYAFVFAVLGLFLFIDSSRALSCWHCIADNCELSPEDNYKAVKRECPEGQSCQKVMIRMQSDVGTATYSSTVRSCAEDCLNQDDFANCTEYQYTTRGCLKRMCCNDEDLCNAARPVVSAWWSVSVVALIGMAIALSAT